MNLRKYCITFKHIRKQSKINLQTILFIQLNTSLCPKKHNFWHKSRFYAINLLEGVSVNNDIIFHQKIWSESESTCMSVFEIFFTLALHSFVIKSLLIVLKGSKSVQNFCISLPTNSAPKIYEM